MGIIAATTMTREAETLAGRRDRVRVAGRETLQVPDGDLALAQRTVEQQERRRQMSNGRQLAVRGLAPEREGVALPVSRAEKMAGEIVVTIGRGRDRGHDRRIQKIMMIEAASGGGNGAREERRNRSTRRDDLNTAVRFCNCLATW